LPPAVLPSEPAPTTQTEAAEVSPPPSIEHAPVTASNAAPEAEPAQQKPAELASATPVQKKASPAKPAKAATAPPSRPLVTANGRWRVQFGAYGSSDLAKGQWAQLSRKIGVLKGLQPSYEPVGALTRLRINSLADRAAAERLCSAAKAAGQTCFAIAP
jgi:cell division protein FtsN